jgi:pimeloyl-ACP methyl ester carboxylesterase
MYEMCGSKRWGFMSGSKQYRIPLPDGRRLGVFECGASKGMPLLYFHGFPGSRLEVLFADQAAAQAGLRLIGIDRPGYGLSDDHSYRQLSDWCIDVRRAADALRIERFSVLGASGGGPFATACAAVLSDRLRCAGIVCGLGPLEDFRTAAAMTWVNRLGLKITARQPILADGLFIPIAYLLHRHPGMVLNFMRRRTMGPDRHIMKRPDIRRILCLSFKESTRKGRSGALADLHLYTRPWGLNLEKIVIPVRLWHGEKDAIVPVAMGKALAAAIPTCRARFYPEAGHFSLIIDHLDKVLAELAECR